MSHRAGKCESGILWALITNILLHRETLGDIKYFRKKVS